MFAYVLVFLSVVFGMGYFWLGSRKVLMYLFAWIGLVGLVGWNSCQVISHSIYYHFSAPTLIHGARISGLEARMDQVEDRICDLDDRGSEEADNLANDRDLDRFILTGIGFVQRYLSGF